MKILVLGGAGFLGQHLIKKINKELPRAQILVLDLKKNPYPFSNIEDYAEVIYGVDIANSESIEKFFRNIDVCFNLVGFVSFWKKDKDKLYKINADLHEGVIKLSLKNNIKLIHISSVASLGYTDDSDVLVDENFKFDFTKVPNKHYMLSKKKGDELILNSIKNKGLQAIIAYPALMWGNGDFFNTAKVIQGIKNGKIKANMCGGTYIADAEDIAAGLLAVLKKGKIGERYILGGHNYTFEEINKIISNELQIDSLQKTIPKLFHKPLYFLFWVFESLYPKKPLLTSDNIDSAFMFRYFDNSKANRELEWEIKKPFSQTIREQINYLENKNLL